MTAGGFTWGLLSIYFDLAKPGMIPIGYVIFSVFNVYGWLKFKNKNVHKALQTFFSILLPFIFQIILGGARSTGVVMIWSLFALTATLAFYKGKALLYWLTIFVILLGIVIMIDHEIEYIAPAQLRDHHIFNLLLMINFSMISSMLFFLSKFFVDQQLKTMDELIETNAQLIAAEEEVRQNSEEIFVMNDTLKETNKKLEDAYVELERNKNDQIDQISHSLIESIDYAKQIQSCFLPQMQRFNEIVSDGFIFFKPLDVVSGDFYWFYKKENMIVIAAVDCTGHGVPGAFMSLLGAESLNNIVISREIYEPDEILFELDTLIRKKLKQERTNNRDGMDIALTVFDTTSKTISFSGAKNPLIYIENKELHLIKGDRQPIGMFHPDQEVKHFTKHTFNYTPNTSFYIYSDGIQDQFGGEKLKKFMPRRLKETLLKHHTLSMKVQKNMVENTFSSWKKDEPQTDDVLLMGFKIS
ncbi:SpoIIE family protein phosphatase [Flammeovirga yaeyamensis]|uniref:SpoIIE family protein phosphatase n=2 Tax=Flammeovirga yaeyamensis TaxID=367791 RepID=A0AAX1N2D3_9BACT|nr:SpoIIE family protein phosphatase [Flammeovirga yaeyamensis]MBB3696277.1 serine phosphatase RsbU (regulator of sigma subunit) [Flammeovirga yaeyamensis]NMF34958.1 SpoIIE family protein phosphatase [Flammeovirga yaeyamensis]QWG00217.1 SpoIIE family protein phosphatase [Flammeovirga yaeyamensis]